MKMTPVDVKASTYIDLLITEIMIKILNLNLETVYEYTNIKT